MKPSHSRPRLWPLAALPAAGFVALIAGASGLSQDQPAVKAPDASKGRVSGSYRAVDAPAPSSDAFKNGRQICYELRYLALDANPWREAVANRLKLVKQETDVCAWIIDNREMKDILASAHNEVGSKILQLPKVTAFENTHAKIDSSRIQSYVAQRERIEKTGSLELRPITKEYETGVWIDLFGSLTRDGTELSVDLRESSLLSSHTLVRKERFHEQDYAASYEVPTVLERSCHVACNVPEGSSLLVSMGLYERRGRLSDAGEAAGEVLKFVGLPPVPARPVSCERLIMMTPREIVLDDETGPNPAIIGSFDDKRRR